MRLQPPFPPFFLRGLGRCRRCGDGGSRGPGGVPRPSAFAAAGRLCRRGRSRVGGVFRRCGGGGFVPGGFRGVAGALLRGLPARRVGGAGGGFSGRLDGRSRCGTRAPSATRARRAGSRPGLGLRRILRRLRRLRGIAGGLLLRVAGRPLRRLLSGVRIPGGTLCGFGSGVPGRFRLLGAGGTLCGLLRGFPRRGGLAQGIFRNRSLGGDRKSGEFLDVRDTRTRPPSRTTTPRPRVPRGPCGRCGGRRFRPPPAVRS